MESEASDELSDKLHELVFPHAFPNLTYVLVNHRFLIGFICGREITVVWAVLPLIW
jgi:hypothetical protein